jgi:hypothetical protein
MKHIGVAALAEHRLLHDQQRLMGGAVRVVAIETTLTDWRVLPQEGAALFAVTLVTLVIDRVRRNEPLSLCAMRIMAVRANHLLFPQGMVRGLHDRRADLLMTAGAKLHLAWLRQQFRISAMNLVAVDAGEFCLIVLAAWRPWARFSRSSSDRPPRGRRHRPRGWTPAHGNSRIPHARQAFWGRRECPCDCL